MLRDLRPTEVQDWKLCPQYWMFKHVEGWKPLTVHKWEVQAWIGTAIHAGIAAWVKQHEDPSGVAQAVFAVCQAEALAQGRSIEVSLEEALSSVRVNTKKFVAQAPAWLQTACWGVEVAFGAARLDWLGKLPGELSLGRLEDPPTEGPWRIVDFKTKRTKPRNLEAYQWGLRRSWQMAEYVERARSHPDSPAYGQQVEQVEIHTIILDKFEVIVDTFTPPRIPESERLKILMEMDPKGVVWRNEQHCRNWYGADCQYLRACWDYEGDRKRMEIEYIQVHP